jgi:hypothetical protein
MLNKELLTKILSENNWGIFLKGSPLEEMSTNVGVMYKINEVDVDKIVDSYNAHLNEPIE